MKHIKYNLYHSNTIISFKLGTLDNEIKQAIPKSTKQYWKQNLSLDSFFHVPKNTLDQMDIKSLEFAAKHKSVLNALNAIKTVHEVFYNIFFSLKQYKSILRNNKEYILNTIDNISKYIHLKKALNLFNISHQKYRYWKNNLYQCSKSAIKQCFNIHPNQLTQKEVKTIEQYLNNKEHDNLYLSNIYYIALRDKAIFISLATWYRYANILNLSRKNQFQNPKKNRIGIRACAPKKVIHMDVTVYMPNDRKPVYIYLIQDNFSRCILGHKASLQCNAQTSFENLKEVIVKYFSNEYAKLIVDGGCENKGEVDRFLSKDDINIEKFVAHIDINTSNSMIEACNK